MTEKRKRDSLDDYLASLTDEERAQIAEAGKELDAMLLEQAADEIERLRQRVAALEAVARAVADDYSNDDDCCQFCPADWGEAHQTGCIVLQARALVANQESETEQ